tara:strand:+ start:1106 stop:4186 length:3081 start_codon:yes stop_codon:yes gene_type:complete
MIQTQLFIDSGRQKTTSYHLAVIEVTSANTVYNTTININLNGTNLPVVFDSSPSTVIAAFIATAINTSGTHRGAVIIGTSKVSIESLIAGLESDITVDAGNGDATYLTTNSTGDVITASPEWQSADMDPSVQITLKDSIKKAKDVGKVFTAYTLPFNLPASKANNLIFKRFSSNKIYEGYDPRRKYAARIKLNGVDFKSGYIKLSKVDMVNNQPVNYSVQFFGELASLKDTIGEGKLKDLVGLAKYTFPFDDETVQLGFEEGFDVVVNDASGERETTVIQVIDAPTSNGDVTLTMNLVPYTLSLIGTGGVTPESTADSLANQINYIDGYSSLVYNNRFVYIVADEVGAQNDATLAGASAIGMTYTIVVPVQGSTIPQPDNNVTISPNSQGMIKFPMISHTRGFEYTKNLPNQEGNHEGFHRLLTYDENNNYYRNPTAPFTIGLQTTSYPAVSADRLSRFDLKPAIKLPYIFEAISESFPSIVWDTEWLFGSATVTKSPIKDMYLWLHNRKGNIAYIDEQNNSLDFSWNRTLRYDGAGTLDGEWVKDLADSTYDFRPFLVTPDFPKNYSFRLYVDQMAADGEITLKIFARDTNTGDLLDHREHTGEASDGTVEVIMNYPFETFLEATEDDGEQRGFYIETEITADSSIGEMRPRLNVEQTYFHFQHGQTTIDNNFGSGTSRVAILANINPAGLMPDYKIMDFLSDLFKMYNLVAFEVPQDDGSIKIKITSYDYYINNGTKRDITKYIDISKGTVERVSPYATIDYSWAERKTFLAINQKSLTGDDFGAANFSVAQFSEGQTGSNSFLFDGGKYEIDIKQEKMMFERINDKPNKNLTPIQWGWFVNDNEENLPEPELGKPLMMYCVNKVIGNPLQETFPIDWADGHRSHRMVTPSNVNASGEQTLHFNSEYDEYQRDINRNSLFLKYHSNMIEGLYSGYAKKIRITAQLPPLVFNVLKLSDTIVVDNISYFIDEMDINITTGKTKFSLLRVTDIKTRLEGRDEGEEAWQDSDVNWEDEQRNWEVKRNL